MRYALILLCAAFGAACWTLTTDTEGLFGGPSAPSLEDAGAATPDAGDGSVSEAGALGRFCETVTPTPTLCIDFEDGDGIVAEFETTTGATARRTDRDGGHALSIEGPADRDGPTAILGRMTEGTPVSARVSFDFRLDAITSGPNAVSFVGFIFRDGPDYHKIDAVLDEDGIIGLGQVGTIGPRGFVEATKPLSRTEWHRIGLEVVFEGTRVARGGADDDVVAELALGAIPAGTDPMVLEIGMGIGPPVTAGPTSFHFDNIVYDPVVR